MRYAITLGVIIMILLLPTVSAETTYTPSTKITENSMTIYAGISFGQENGEWIPIEEMKSLKGTGIDCIVDYDGVHIAECLDYNFTSIKLKFKGDNIPENKKDKVKIAVYYYDEEDKIKKEKYKFYIDLSEQNELMQWVSACLLYTSPSPRDRS